MKKRELLIYVCFLCIVIAVIISSSINGNDRYQSFSIGALGPAIGLILGTLIRKKKSIIDRKKFKFDLLLSLFIAFTGSIIMCLLIEQGEVLVIGVLSLNGFMIGFFTLRNIKNIE